MLCPACELFQGGSIKAPQFEWLLEQQSNTVEIIKAGGFETLPGVEYGTSKSANPNTIAPPTTTTIMASPNIALQPKSYRAALAAPVENKAVLRPRPNPAVGLQKPLADGQNPIAGSNEQQYGRGQKNTGGQKNYGGGNRYHNRHGGGGAGGGGGQKIAGGGAGPRYGGRRN
ncbi:hypothetical protein ABW19_dt0207306 [Dactylella cylindrospora]|nr:hypothetical protein ABW19_dt0207306 [Dactylella cylindrospora]